MRFLLLLIALGAILEGECAVVRQMAKVGDRVSIDASFAANQEIHRKVAAGEQTFHLEGKLKGKLTCPEGKVLDSSNFAIEQGNMVIKRFSDADAGSYGSGEARMVRNSDGSMSGVAGNMLIIEVVRDY